MKHFFASLCIILMAVPCMAGEKVVLVSNEYIPYVNTSSKERGFFPDVILAAFAEVDIEAEIQFKPWRRCAMMVEDGSAVGTSPELGTEKRQKYAWFSDPIWQSRHVFFYLKGRMGDYDFTTFEDLKGRLIAGTAGNYYEDVFRDAGLTMDYAPSEVSGVRKVREMRTEFFVEDELVGWALISRLFPKEKHMFGSTPTPWDSNPQSMMVSKKYPGAERLMEQFHVGLKAIRENGVFDAIFERYMAGCPVKIQ